MIRKSFRSILISASALLFTATGVTAYATDAVASEPVPRAAGLPNRVGILILDSNPSQPWRTTQAGADAEMIGRRLNEFGFTTVAIISANRPDLDRQLRDAAGKIRASDDVAVFALGRYVSSGDDVWVVRGDAPAEVEARPNSLATEALRLSDALRRLSRAGPQTMSVIVDECAPVANETCAINEVARAAGATADVSIVATSRITAPLADGRPRSSMTSGGSAILNAMTVEDADFLNFFERQKKELYGGNLTAKPTVALSTIFAFWPAVLFDMKPIPCNKVDSEFTIEKVRETDVDALVQSCRTATQNWSHVGAFKTNLSIATEQSAVKAIPRGCDGLLKARAFLATYPSCRWRAPVESQIADCEAKDAARRSQRPVGEACSPVELPSTANRGELELDLSWAETAELDLSLRCPNGRQVSYREKIGCGATLDLDANFNFVSRSTVGYIIWTKIADAPAGQYTVIIETYMNRDASNSAVSFEVFLTFRGHMIEHKAAEAKGFEYANKIQMFTFNLPLADRLATLNVSSSGRNRFGQPCQIGQGGPGSGSQIPP